MKKTQATQSKNPDLEGFQNSQIQMRKTRFFSLMTYATENQINKVFKDHMQSIRAFCYIYHDKDDATPHYHIILRTHSSWSSAQLRKWFLGLVDKEKKPINTFCEPANDLNALKDYLTHSDEESREKGKYEYSVTDIRDYGLWDIVPQNNSYDDTYEILNKVITGVSYRELVRQYGRKFLYHWEMYANMACEIRQDEGFREARLRSLQELMGAPKYEVIKDMEDFIK